MITITKVYVLVSLLQKLLSKLTSNHSDPLFFCIIIDSQIFALLKIDFIIRIICSLKKENNMYFYNP